MGVFLHAHPVRGELYIQRNIIRDVATVHYQPNCVAYNNMSTDPCQELDQPCLSIHMAGISLAAQIHNCLLRMLP